jgi:hypothetical protein
MGQHRSPLSCLTHIVRSEGISGLCRGYLPTLCRELPGNAIFFTTYEGLRRALPGRGAAAEAFVSDGADISSSAMAAAWHVAVDAGGAIFCGAAAGVVVSCTAVSHGNSCWLMWFRMEAARCISRRHLGGAFAVASLYCIAAPLQKTVSSALTSEHDM